MRLSNYDRLMAISRCPEYIKDYEEISNLFKEGVNKTDPKKVEAFLKQILKKWSLQNTVRPALTKESSITFEVNERKPIKVLNDYEWPVNAIYRNFIAIESGYKYVQLKIDLTNSEKELKKAFVKIIAPSRKKERTFKSTEYDPWKVYDMYLAKNNFTEIARNLSGFTGNPNEDYDLKLARKKVINAYKRAKEIIKSIVIVSDVPLI